MTPVCIKKKNDKAISSIRNTKVLKSCDELKYLTLPPLFDC